MDINPTLSVRSVTASALPATGKRRKLTNNLQRINHASDQPESNIPSQHKTALRILNQEIENACLMALMGDFTSWWDNIPQAGSMQSRLEQLLFQFERHEIGDLMAYQFREVLLLNGIKVSATAASDALATVKAVVSADDQFLSFPPLAAYPNNYTSMEEYEKWRKDWISTNLKAVASQGAALEQLIALQKRPGYQDCSLESLTRAVQLAGMEVSRDLVKLAQTAHRTNLTDAQQKWFDASWKHVSGINKKERLASLLSQPGRPPLKAPELWLLLYKAEQRIGLTTVRNMLSAATVNIEQAQIKRVIDTWNSLDHRYANSIVPQLMRLLLLLENQTNLQPIEVLVALTEGDVDVNTTAMGHAAAAVRAKFTQADMAWIKSTWPRINRELPQFMQMMDLLKQYPDLANLTPSKVVRLLWEIDEYVCPATIGNVLGTIKQQRDDIIIPDDLLPELIDLEPESPPPAVAMPASPVRFQLSEQDELFPLQEQEWKWQLDQELDP